MRILIVEDNATFRETVRELLRDLGYKVRGARSYNKAVKRLTRHKFDLVLSDMDIGDGSGFDVLELARQTRPEAPIVLMSGDADPSTVQAALASGAAQFLPKPFGLKELMQTIEAALNEATPNSETDTPSE
ncbi:MAG: response regulator [Chloroflexi bacterium CFX4]|nr:response regulator [Chloroflexi bacterium CFX4]MDL1921778.1 response regulator [Chloroflexi bacterium CFX3]